MMLEEETDRQFIRPASKSMLQLNKRARQPEPTKIDKRQRIPREDLENMVFKLFESKAYWSLKELTESTDQPVSFLKEVLNDICTLHRRGKYKSKYELKPEYKTTESATVDPAAGQAAPSTAAADESEQQEDDNDQDNWTTFAE